MIEIVWHPRRAHFTVALLSLSVFHYLLSPIIAAAAMSFSSVSVVTNALRLRRVSL